MEVPAAFRSRRPPKREVYTKLCVLIAFCVFCAAVGFRVKDIPLPSGKHRDSEAAQSTEEPVVSTFPTFSPEERANIAQLAARIPVPYLVPWGADERPAVFFMWHLLYRSLKPDLNLLATRLRQSSNTTSTPGQKSDPSPAPSIATGAVRGAAELKVVLEVLETQEGYITTSLARYLPHAHVFSVVANASTEAVAPAARNRRGHPGHRRARGPPLEALLAERRGFSEAVAAKVERVLASPQAENVTEATHEPGMNGVLPTLDPRATATADGVGDGKGTAAPIDVAQKGKGGVVARTEASPRLLLCVPHSGLNASYVTAAASEGLRVHYQVVLFPYVVLQGVSGPSTFDAALRTLLQQASMATFIALPSLTESDVPRTPDGNATETGAPPGLTPQQPLQHAAFHAQELKDYDAWYGVDGRAPTVVLQRALGVPEITEKYHVSIAALGSKRWAGALRQLHRVELRRKTPRATTAMEAAAVDGAPNVTRTATASPISTPFGCLARQRLLGCMARPLHSTCENFIDAHFS